MMPAMKRTLDELACGDCSHEGSDRRAFLRSAGCFATTFALMGLLGKDMAAHDISFVTGSQAGNERTYPVPAADGVTIDRDAQVIIARSSGRVVAMALACPHQNAAVKWLANDHRFQCTRHDSQYQPDGVYTSGRATRNMDRFPIRLDGTTLHVDVTRVFHSDQDPAGWSAASVPIP